MMTLGVMLLSVHWRAIIPVYLLMAKQAVEKRTPCLEQTPVLDLYPEYAKIYSRLLKIKKNKNSLSSKFYFRFEDCA